MKIKSLGLKVSLIVALMVALLVVIIIYIVSAQSSAMILDLTAKEAQAANVTLNKEMARLQESALMRARLIAYSNDIVDAILEDNEAALRTAVSTYDEGIDSVIVTNPNGVVLMRSYSNEKGDNISYQKALSQALRTDESTMSFENDPELGITVRGSATIHDYDGNLIGAVVASHDLVNPSYVDYVKDLTNSEVTIFDMDTRLMSTIKDESGNRVVGTKMTNQAVIDAVLNRKEDFSLTIPLFGHEYKAHYSPLIYNNEAIGMLFTGVSIEEAMGEQQAMINTVIMIGIICGVACIVIVFIFNVMAVSRPLKKIGAFADRIKTGDIGVSSKNASDSKIAVRSSDEVGRLARALELAYLQLQGYVGEIQTRMNGLADGDLATESTYAFDGDFILIKDSINDHIRNLNNTMAEINGSSSQVSTGSKQIADGAQSLAQGSTEQAASVQQLSASIGEIAQKTKDNAEMAERAASLANSIMQNAEKGSRQMDEMTVAVKEINQASQSISKVIKVIDDIAFQTNILALNAAVEAARAGQHGKGFAVVAEEVRNLAAKSAEAAKDTGGLIANSMEKAELGARIAEDTAVSLSEIVSGIGESTALVNDIARSSEEQSQGIAQINSGIDQVAQVVQQNSATAEQSAAASEEMSGQSTMLQQLISQFKLSEKDNIPRGLPPADHY